MDPFTLAMLALGAFAVAKAGKPTKSLAINNGARLATVSTNKLMQGLAFAPPAPVLMEEPPKGQAGTGYTTSGYGKAAGAKGAQSACTSYGATDPVSQAACGKVGGYLGDKAEEYGKKAVDEIRSWWS